MTKVFNEFETFTPVELSTNETRELIASYPELKTRKEYIFDTLESVRGRFKVSYVSEMASSFASVGTYQITGKMKGTLFSKVYSYLIGGLDERLTFRVM